MINFFNKLFIFTVLILNNLDGQIKPYSQPLSFSLNVNTPITKIDDNKSIIFDQNKIISLYKIEKKKYRFN